MGAVEPIDEPIGWDELGCHPDRPVAHLSVGNPHSVVGVDEVGAVDLVHLGSLVPHINLEIVEPGPEPNAITMRVHERGAGITEACGTGAVASAFAALQWGLVPASLPEIVVHMDGGSARVAVDRDDGSDGTDRPGDLRRTNRDRDRDRHHVSTPYNEALGSTLIDRSVRERIVIVGVTLPGTTDEQTEASLDELALLVDTAGADEVARLVQRRDAPDHTWFIGKGKAEELRQICVGVDADTVVFDNELAPAQQYNLEKLLGRTAIDRTAVILDIFGQNAHTLEGKAQVELALLALPPAAPAAGRDRQAVAAARRRRRPVRQRRDQARGRSPADHAPHHQARVGHEGSGGDALAAAQESQSRAVSRRSASSATRTPASPRCSTTSPRPACSSRIACSPRSTRRRAGWRCPAVSRSCSPTRSGSCAACRTGSSRRSRARSRSRRGPTTWCTSSTPAPPTRTARSPRCARCCARSAPITCPSCSCSTRPTSHLVPPRSSRPSTPDRSP